MKIGLALAGGGARGIAHIGLLQTLQRRSVTPHVLAGTSAGAIIAAMYAARPDADWVEKRFREFLESPEFRALGTERLARHHRDPEAASPFGKRLKDHFAVNLSLIRQFVIPRPTLNAAVEFLVPARRFRDLALPLVVTATELQRGEVVYYDSGDLTYALANSASIPGILEPELTHRRITVDGGVLCPVPVACLQHRAEFVIASEISRRGLPPLDNVSIYALMMRAEQLSQLALAEHQARLADFVFEPDVMGLHWSQFGSFDSLVANGRTEAEARWEAFEETLTEHRSWRTRLKRWLVRRLTQDETDAGPTQQRADETTAPAGEG